MTRHAPPRAARASSQCVSTTNLARLPKGAGSSWTEATPQEVVKLPRASFSFLCSMPPTANHMHTVARGRKIKSAEYRAWQEMETLKLTVLAASSDHYLRFDAPVGVSINLPRQHKLSDLDNRIKPIIDLIEAAGVIVNDNLVHRIEAMWKPSTYQDQEKNVSVYIWELT